jgi:predicted permease
MSGIRADLRYVFRVLRRSPGFTLVAVLSLAIGIGANTAMFGVVRTLLLTPLPVRDPSGLRLVTWKRDGDVRVSQTGSTGYRDPATGTSLNSNFSYPLYRSLREATPGEAVVFGFAFLRGVSVARGDQPAFVAGGALVDGDYFGSLRPRMALGRGIARADDRPDAPLVAVISHSFWGRAFGGDPSVIGSTVRVNGVIAEIVGVTARGFKGLSPGGFFPQTEITLPISAQPQVWTRLLSDGSAFASEELFWLRLMARVPAGVPVERVEQALGAALRSVPSPLLGGDGHLPELRLIDGSRGAQPVGESTARLLWFLLGVVGIVLLIACVNLASLMLGRGVGRQREMAVRRALGGGRGHIMRQILIEALVLAGAGTALGLALTLLSRGFLRSLLTGSLGSGAFGDLDMQVSLDPVVLGVCATLAVVSTLAFGLLPALRLSGIDPIGWLKQRGAGATQPRLTVGRVLIAVQVAVSVPLVVGALLFLRTVATLGSVDLGFDPTGVVSFQVDPGYTRLPPEDYPRLYQELLARIERVPGVRSVTLIENAPASGIVSNGSIDVNGERVVLYRNGIGPAFLETMGARLLEGRMPGLQDGPDVAPVGVVNETAVREVFGASSPLGRTLRLGGREVLIVGVINDMVYRDRRSPVPPTLYESAFQRSAWGGYHVFLRTGEPFGRMEARLREAVTQVNADVPVPTIRSQTEIMAQTGARERVFTQLLTLFGGFALLLASIGLHGVTAYSVTRRTSEIGVRVAVGARPAQILWMVLGNVLLLSAIGLLLGVPVAIAAAPLVGSLLYGVAPGSPVAIAAAAAAMLAVAAGAGLWPALRASRLDALAALRAE